VFQASDGSPMINDGGGGILQLDEGEEDVSLALIEE
jgi:hypothetical protein